MKTIMIKDEDQNDVDMMTMSTMMMVTMMTAMTKAGSALPTPQLPARTIQNPQRQGLFTCKLCFGTKGATKKTHFKFYTRKSQTH